MESSDNLVLASLANDLAWLITRILREGRTGFTADDHSLLVLWGLALSRTQQLQRRDPGPLLVMPGSAGLAAQALTKILDTAQVQALSLVVDRLVLSGEGQPGVPTSTLEEALALLHTVLTHALRTPGHPSCNALDSDG